ncbi:MerR family transcriptional regulator [Paenibacillus sp. GSMTC-2017]|uniref:MerR family transcriptional regulator n=1 Tax=Paenibacillus sp. GSMTC-2017 TaxID=2794350 RepID=UPI0018D8ACB7|nr:MerR family transcriptional regulator [Paenibacillus sp. GSMTC-2017]MBH5317909.1 MerR family transcriptional regulator [Paenibacillus sp. GSMTC-2017]
MKVHEAAKALGVTPRTLRFYEEKGLIAPIKEIENGYRFYRQEDIETLRWIVSLRELGMSLTDIKEIVANIDNASTFIRKLDLARSALYAELSDTIAALRAFDETMDVWRRSGVPKLDQAEQSAKQLREQRELRTSWSDRWKYDEIALQYGENAPLVALSRFIEPKQYEQALIRTAEWIDPRSEEEGLELGAGSGNLSVMLDSPNVHLTLIEQSAEMLSILRERLPHADTRQGNLLALPLNGRVFHFIACSFALQHLDHNGQLLALAEMDRVLHTKGRIVITGFMCNKNSPDNEDQGITPSLLPELMKWLQLRHYSVITEQLNEEVFILFAEKL